MVRDKNTIFAEPNNEDTVLAVEDSNELRDDGLILAGGSKSIKHKIVDYGSILYIVNGIAQELKIQPSKRLGTDSSGNLTWV